MRYKVVKGRHCEIGPKNGGKIRGVKIVNTGFGETIEERVIRKS
jgi:hypothetical protein